MPIAPPVVLTPFNGTSFSTNVYTQKFSGTAPVGTIQVYINGSAVGVNYNLTTREWSYQTDLLVDDGDNTFSFQSYDGFDFSTPHIQVITYNADGNFERTLSQPTGIALRAYVNAIEIVVEEPLNVLPFQIPVGYNFYYSTETGLNFTKLNSLPIRSPAEIVKSILEVKAEPLPTDNFVTYEQLSGNFTKKTTVATEIYQEVGRYIYRHTPTSPVPLDVTKPAFYFVTAIYQEEDLNTEFESAPSEEFVTQAIAMDATIRGLPQRARLDIEADYINYLYQTDPSLDLAPQSIMRELYVAPFANEVEKLRFLVDFYSRAQSFITLVQLDDADGDGVSDPVASSVYKQKLKIALGVVADEEVQQLIDEAFIKLAGNLNVPKLQATKATGYVTVRSRTLNADIIISRGATFSTAADLLTGSIPVFFSSDVSAQMLKTQSSSYYNSSTGYFEITIPVTALVTGSAANVATDTVKRIVSGVVGSAEVTNLAPIRYGYDEESNVSLAERSLLALVGVDSGTKGGYLFNGLKISGAKNLKIVSSGDALMVRDLVPIPASDYTTSRGFSDIKHVWGTVDIYAQGTGPTTATETFSFANATLVAEKFKVVSSTLQQIAPLNTAVTSETPIFSVTKISNYTRDGEYDLTGLQIIGGVTLALDYTLPANKDLGMCDTDTIRVDYSYRVSQDLVFSNQPVVDVLVITGDLSGDLSQNFNLYRRSHPLYEGMSTQAGDYIRLFYANNKPVGTLQSYSEYLTLVEEYPIPLTRYGIVATSIVVKNQEETITYVKNVDYAVLPPSDLDNRFRIRRIDAGSINNADSVLVAYSHGENITVSYRYQALPQRIADELETKRHIDADLLVKTSIESYVDIEATIVMRTGFTTEVVDGNVRSNISRFFSLLKMGNPVHESDIIALMDNTLGVDFVINPLTKLNRSDNTLILDEQLPDMTWSVHGTDIVTSYITDFPVLQYNTIDKGGRDVALFSGTGIERRIVGIRDGHLVYVQTNTESEVARSSGKCYIRADGKLIVSTYDGQDPTYKTLYVTYYTYGETGSRSIFPAANEVLLPGLVNLRLLTLSEAKNGG